MNHELDVEALHPAARLALARAGLLDAAEPLAEGEIGLFDRILDERSIDFVGKRIDESRVAFELCEAERRTQRPDQSVHDVGDDVLGMVEFDAGHEMRVAGYVGDHETGRLRFRKHCSALPFGQRHRRHGPGSGTRLTTTRQPNQRMPAVLILFGNSGRAHPLELTRPTSSMACARPSADRPADPPVDAYSNQKPQRAKGAAQIARLARPTLLGTVNPTALARALLRRRDGEGQIQNLPLAARFADDLGPEAFLGGCARSWRESIAAGAQHDIADHARTREGVDVLVARLHVGREVLD